MAASPPDLTIGHTSILAPIVKKLLSLPVSPSVRLGRATGGENPSIVGSTDDTATKGEILLTTGSYAEPVVKVFITAGYSTRRGPISHKPVVMHITAKVIGEGPSGELTFYNSVSYSSIFYF
jgi:hypothetical protein